ncbi:MAG: GIY-YIG nuclease family protein [Bacillota bacterium]
MTSFLYIVECFNNGLYTGITNDLPTRFQSHLAGKGSKYCRAFKVKELKAAWQFEGEKNELISLENTIQNLSRSKKLELILNPEKMDIYLNKSGMNGLTQNLDITEFKRVFCPCTKVKSCKHHSNCSSCIGKHLTQLKQPPRCFATRAKWVKDVVKNYKLQGQDQLDHWTKS